MKSQEYVLVYDSGIGGLSTLSCLKKTCPNLNYLYYADTKNCPYGSKSVSELQALILDNIKSLESKFNIIAIVLACNTATTSSAEFLRQKLAVPIIGTEPNVKEPERQGYGHICVLATPLTIKQNKLLNLENTINANIRNIGMKNLAQLIEEYELSQDKHILRQILQRIKKTMIKIPKSTAIVLGCTHYIFVKKHIENLGYTCFDGNTGVAKRLKTLMQDNLKTTKGIIKIVSAQPNFSLKYKKVFKRHHLKSRKNI